MENKKPAPVKGRVWLILYSQMARGTTLIPQHLLLDHEQMPKRSVQGTYSYPRPGNGGRFRRSLLFSDKRWSRIFCIGSIFYAKHSVRGSGVIFRGCLWRLLPPYQTRYAGHASYSSPSQPLCDFVHNVLNKISSAEGGGQGFIWRGKKKAPHGGKAWGPRADDEIRD